MDKIKGIGTWEEHRNALNHNFGLIQTMLDSIRSKINPSYRFFNTMEELQRAIPTAREGEQAYIGTQQPYKIFRWVADKWTDTQLTESAIAAPVDKALDLNSDNAISNSTVTGILTVLSEWSETVQPAIDKALEECKPYEIYPPEPKIGITGMKSPEILSFSEKTTAEDYNVFFQRYSFDSLFAAAETGMKKIIAISHNGHYTETSYVQPTILERIELRPISVYSDNSLFPLKTITFLWESSGTVNTLVLRQANGVYSARRKEFDKNHQYIILQ